MKTKVENTETRKLYWSQSCCAWIASITEGHGLTLEKPVPPEVEKLCQTLLSIGGTMVCVFFNELASTTTPLIAEGEVMKHDKASCTVKEVSKQHDSWGELWRADRAAYRFMTGYSLWHDGMWRRHSWLVTKTNEMLATDPDAKIYFGIEISGWRAEIFSSALL